MDYSSSIKNLFHEISFQASYSRLHPVLRIVMTILMLPFIVLGAFFAIVYYLLLFLKNGSQISVEELEAWLNKRKEGAHFVPEAVLYFVTIPCIFFFRVLLTIFSGVLYFVWAFLMLCAYVATLGGIRWQPYLNRVSYDKEYTWDFKHSNTVFNVFAIVDLSLVLLCVFQALLYESNMAKSWLLALTAVLIYVVSPKIFSKADIRELNTPEEIYNRAIAYSEVKCLANYTRASALMKKIPDYEDAAERIEEFDSYINERKTIKADVGRVLMVMLAVVVAMLAIIPPLKDTVSIGNKHIVYFENDDGTYTASCDSYSVKNAEISAMYNGDTVTRISNSAFDKCQRLRTVEIPRTIKSIGNYAFRNCESLEKIIFNGTKDQWDAIDKGTSWNSGTGYYVVECTDGVIRTKT